MVLMTAVVAAMIAEPRDLSSELEKIRRNHDVASMVCAIYHDGELVGSGASGWYSYEDTTPVTIESKYHIGSCTKAMTSVLIGMLVEEGKIDWDTPVAEALAEVSDEVDEHWETVTIRDLLGHRAGIMESHSSSLLSLPWYVNSFDKLLDQRDQRATIASAVLQERPQLRREEDGSMPYAYSNFGYILAGVIAETHYDTPFEDLLRERIFEPLGMASAGFGPPGELGAMIEPVGHAGGEEWNPMLLEKGKRLPDNPPAYAPAGRVHASVIDWGKFVNDFDRGLDGEGKLLKSETYQAIALDADGDGYALGWGVSQRDWAGGKTLSHSGSNRFWYCVTWTAPERDLVMVCATNVPPNPGQPASDEAIGMMLNAFQDAPEPGTGDGANSD
ncbi:MAG: hypothetical protein Phyf2KO_14130 [Phycisphaerales bacterium]